MSMNCGPSWISKQGHRALHLFLSRIFWKSSIFAELFFHSNISFLVALLCQSFSQNMQAVFKYTSHMKNWWDSTPHQNLHYLAMKLCKTKTWPCARWHEKTRVGGGLWQFYNGKSLTVNLPKQKMRPNFSMMKWLVSPNASMKGMNPSFNEPDA